MAIIFGTNTTTGNQTNFTGTLGHRFTVNKPIVVTQLGWFDSDSDGMINSSFTVTLARYSDQVILTTVTFTTADPGTLYGSTAYRFKPITPIYLAPGVDYMVYNYGHNASDPDYNSSLGGSFSVHLGDNHLSFISSYYDIGSTSFPTSSGGGAYFGGGNFIYETVKPQQGTSNAIQLFNPLTINDNIFWLTADPHWCYSDAGTTRCEAGDSIYRWYVVMASYTSLLKGLTNWWPLSESSGNRLPLFGSTTLTQNGTVSTTTGNLYTNAATGFSGSNYFSTSGLTVGGADFTVAGWINWGGGGGVFQNLANSGWNSSSGDWWLGLQNGVPSLYSAPTGGGSAFGVGGAISTGTWTHICFTYNNTTGKQTLYVNGTNSNTLTNGTLSGGLSGTNGFAVGRDSYDTSNPADNSSIGPIGIWNRVLSKQEVYFLAQNMTYPTFYSTTPIYFEQTDANRRPILRQDLDGWYAEFDFTDDGMISNVPNVLLPFTAFIVEKTVNSSGYQRTIQSGTTNSLMSLTRPYGNSYYISQNISDTYNSKYGFIHTGLMNATNSVPVIALLDNKSIANGNAPGSDWGTVCLGTSGAYYEPAGTKLRDVAFYSRSLTTYEGTRLHDWAINPKWLTQYLPGNPGEYEAGLTYCKTVQGAIFTGGNNLIASSSSVFALSTLSISLWFNTTVNNSSYHGLSVKESAYGIFLIDNKIGTYDWTAGTTFLSSTTYNDGNWHHVVLTLDAGVTNGSKIYIDGTLASTYTYNIAAQTGTFYLGANSGTQNYVGYLDSVGIAPQLLNASDVSWLYNSGIRRTYPELVSNSALLTKFSGGSWYDLNEISGSRTDNISSNTLSQNGTVNGYATNCIVGDPIMAWYDKNNNRPILSQIITANCPILRQDISGKYYAEFSGSQWISYSGYSDDGIADICVAFAARMGGDGQAFGGPGDISGAGHYRILLGYTGQWFLNRYYDDVTVGTRDTNDNTHICRIIGGNSFKWDVSGTEYTNSLNALSSISSSEYILGARAILHDFCLNGRIYSAVITNGTVTDPQKNRLRDYLRFRMP